MFFYPCRLKATIDNINLYSSGVITSPFTLWTGNGYHVYVVFNLPEPLENIEQFADLSINSSTTTIVKQENQNQEISEQFMRFAKAHLSNNMADSGNNPAFKTCLLRIPYSYNEKKDDKGQISMSEVTIIQLLSLSSKSLSSINNNSNVGIHELMPLLIEFQGYLISEKLESDRRKKLAEHKHNNIRLQAMARSPQFNDKALHSIGWIDKILQNGIDDYRKNHVPMLILAPYLINIKHMKYAEAFKLMSDWYYNKCKPLRSIDKIKVDSVVASALNNAIETKIKPINPITLKRFNPVLYRKVLGS